MAVWQNNLERLLRQKEVLVLHGNVRDSAYLKKNGDALPGLSPLLRNVARTLDYQRAVFWGVFFDLDGKGHTPIWSFERVESLLLEQAPEQHIDGGENQTAGDDKNPYLQYRQRTNRSTRSRRPRT